jgi:hypothetical protein
VSSAAAAAAITLGLNAQPGNRVAMDKM